jgi:NTE family protein
MAKAKPKEKLVDAVFEGGGVKGIGLAGAVSVVEAEGYTWGNLAGTSAGAIVAAVLAAGYTAAELKDIVGGLDYNKFMDKGGVDRVPLLGPLISLIAEKGVYEGDYLEEWMTGLLEAKGKRTFADLVIPGEKDPRYRYKLNVITSDVSRGKLVVLPTGLKDYGVDPDGFPVAKAVRMSMSIPFFFEPVQLAGSTFVDGGLLSNFPVWLFDAKGKPSWPTFGFKLVEPEEGRPNDTGTTLAFAKALITTMLDAHDKMHVEDEDFERTIAVPTLGVKTTEFGLSPERRDALFQSGVKGAEEFFKYWDFRDYVRRHRVKRDKSYVKRVAVKKTAMTM